ncbi:Synaptic vesicle transporter SVOP and related transporters (major facilitator superfamily) [Ceraceosorus bombacis]|uniref:Synaptic vesicle transporter SVOP and related transporters (Major facilitator superfamily) n=1 Tax=Ceraceosorus bombacis TaxID=401625 RepID=A0A0P1BCB8_9BASI|nr:Synaptic vesicle transporter SVOP and related transporters (major facilitator superfamily) [Ceraceosorus bombacis]
MSSANARPHKPPVFHVPPRADGARAANASSSNGLALNRSASRSRPATLTRNPSRKDYHNHEVNGGADPEFGHLSRSGTHESALGPKRSRSRSQSRGATTHTSTSKKGTSVEHRSAKETLTEEVRRWDEEDKQHEAVQAAELAEVRQGGDGEHAKHLYSNAARKESDGFLRRSESSARTAQETDLEMQAAKEGQAESGPEVEGTAERKEAATSSVESSSSLSQKEADANVVGWDGSTDPANPRNWSLHRRWAVIVIVSTYTFLSPLSSSMVAPALPLIASQLSITSSVSQSLVLSVFVLAYAIGPLFLAPLSEMFGRKLVLQFSNAFFIALTVACAVAPSASSLTAFRFLAGLGGSAPLVIGGGEVESHNSWRWIFGAAAIAAACVATVGLFVLPETYAPRILADKAKRLRKETGNSELRTIFEKEDEAWYTRMRRHLVRPFIFIGTQPAVQLLSLYMLIIYGIMYLLLTTWNETYTQRYGQSVGIASLNYIALAIGFTLGGQISGRAVDRIYRRLRDRAGGKGAPEMKIPVMMFAGPLAPAGLLIYGWSAEYRVHWIVPDIGGLIFAIGMLATFTPIQSYIVDSYTLYAASAIGAVAFLRSLAGFGFPLFAPTMYAKLGLGWGNTILALVLALVGIPAPFLLYRFGATLRAKSTYCATPQG